jgi:hypothetical protein
MLLLLLLAYIIIIYYYIYLYRANILYEYDINYINYHIQKYFHRW